MFVRIHILAKLAPIAASPPQADERKAGREVVRAGMFGSKKHTPKSPLTYAIACAQRGLQFNPYFFIYFL